MALIERALDLREMARAVADSAPAFTPEQRARIVAAFTGVVTPSHVSQEAA